MCQRCLLVWGCENSSKSTPTLATLHRPPVTTRESCRLLLYLPAVGGHLGKVVQCHLISWPGAACRTWWQHMMALLPKPLGTATWLLHPQAPSDIYCPGLLFATMFTLLTCPRNCCVAQVSLGPGSPPHGTAAWLGSLWCTMPLAITLLPPKPQAAAQIPTGTPTALSLVPPLGPSTHSWASTTTACGHAEPARMHGCTLTRLPGFFQP